MIGAIRPQGGKRWLGVLLRAVAVAMLSAGSGHAQPPPPAGGQVVTPGSSIEQPGDTGVRAHTNIQIFIPNQPPVPSSPSPNREGDAIDHGPPRTAGTGGTVRPQ